MKNVVLTLVPRQVDDGATELKALKHLAWKSPCRRGEMLLLAFIQPSSVKHPQCRLVQHYFLVPSPR